MKAVLPTMAAETKNVSMPECFDAGLLAQLVEFLAKETRVRA